MIIFVAIDGEAGLDGPIEDVAKMEAQEAEHLLNHLGIPVSLFLYSLSMPIQSSYNSHAL